MAVTSPNSAEDLDLRLDELIPPPAPPARRLVVGAAILAAAMALTMLNIGGWLYPAPTRGGSFSSGGALDLEPGRDLVTAEVMLPNWSNRDIRVTKIDLAEADGVRVAEAGLRLEDVDSSMGPEVPLPATIPAGRTAWLVLSLQPTDCAAEPTARPEGPWGVARVTVDFGAGAPPWISRTIRIEQDPIALPNADVNVLANGNMINDTNPLVAICEALR